MQIKVTQDDIDNGQRGCAAKCPIALALKRQTTHSVTIASCDIHIYDYKHKNVSFTRISTPNVCVEFMADFDNKKPVKPFEFDLDYN